VLFCFLNGVVDLAGRYTDPTTNPAAKEALAALFMVVHQYGGVVLGEHIGQFFIIIWMSMISAILYRSASFPKWVSFLGWLAAIVYLLAQTELLATVIPGMMVVDWAGLVGSLLWLLWMIVMGVYVFRSKEGAG
jgi:hypothetical protein